MRNRVFSPGPHTPCSSPCAEFKTSLSPGHLGAEAGAAPVQRVRRGSRRGVQAMVDVPRALPLSPQQRWALRAPLFPLRALRGQ